MAQNIIEYARQLSIEQLFKINSFSSFWPAWDNEIRTHYLSSPPTQRQIYDLGDHLRDLFKTTGQSGRDQGEVSVGGTCWEALVCWYLNLCLIGRRTFVIKHHRELIPTSVAMSVTVNYGNFPSNTESDLIAITFPDKPEYSMDKNTIQVSDEDNNPVVINPSRRYPFMKVLNALTERDFSEIEIHIIQCKTNWNDNSQIPMLWDAVYSASNFRNGITVGSNGYSIHDCHRFTYSFVTVPSNQLVKDGKEQYSSTSTCVLRVKNLSGGNYWGVPSKNDVASSIKELLQRNLKSGHTLGLLNTIQNALPDLATDYSYFQL